MRERDDDSVMATSVTFANGWTTFYYERGHCKCGLKTVQVEGRWNNEDAAVASVSRGDTLAIFTTWK
jgi:hypothetical protein